MRKRTGFPLLSHIFGYVYEITRDFKNLIMNFFLLDFTRKSTAHAYTHSVLRSRVEDSNGKFESSVLFPIPIPIGIYKI